MFHSVNLVNRQPNINVFKNCHFLKWAQGDTLVSYLPYFGRAYNIPYGGGKGLNFTAPILSYERVRIKKNLTRVTLMTENEEDQYLYELEIFDNGSSTIWVRSRQREDIHYSGEMI